MDDGEGTVSLSKGEFNVDLDEYNMDENNCDSKMSWNGKDLINDISYQGNSEVEVMNKKACEFAMKYPKKMMSPLDSREMTEEDIKEYLMETTDMNEQEIEAEYQYINSMTMTLENGLYQMKDACMVHMKSEYQYINSMTMTLENGLYQMKD